MNVEILAPAGNIDSLKAAVKAGADAVYLGLTTLNARRGAANFEPDKLSEIVQLAHDYDTRVYLTLNIDLTDREVGQAFRIIELASQVGVDAVLVRDPALLFLPEFYPNLEFHFSTQAACCNLADMEAAEQLGIKRVVLARENTLDEIKELASVNNVETEAFVQGALCFSVSGRCLLSSWGGGRSGNRGTCTSPCRVPWGVGEENVGTGTPFSMHDLSAASKITELTDAGVDSFKIEGRLKKPEWVADAVSLYRNAIENGCLDEAKANKLGEYTGRKITDSYLSGSFSGLTGRSGRIASEELEALPQERGVAEPEEKTGAVLTAKLNLSGPKIVLSASCDEKEFSREITKSKAGKRAVPVKDLLAGIKSEGFDGISEIIFEVDDPEFPVANRFGKTISTDLANFVRSCIGTKTNKNTKKVKNVNITLMEPVKEFSLRPQPSSENSVKLGKKAWTIRLKADFIEEFAEFQKPYYILEDLVVADLELAAALYGPDGFSAALPSIFYNSHMGRWQDVVKTAAKLGVTVEVNSWGGLNLATEAGCDFEAGPGLAVLNGRAADKLSKLGCKRVCWSIEADKKILADLTRSTPIPAQMYVYGYPVLMQSRVEFPEAAYGKEFKDRRGISMQMTREDGLSVLRSVVPYSLLGMSEENIKASVFVLDLTGCADPMAEYENINAGKYPKEASRFNFDRTLA